jgi:hypothetical protein
MGAVGQEFVVAPVAGTQEFAPAPLASPGAWSLPAATLDRGESQPTPGGAPRQFGSYSAEISRRDPACLILLVDQSGSMEEPIAGGSGVKKKEAVADAINRLLYNTVIRCTKDDGVRQYFDVGIWTYGGAAQVRRVFEHEVVSIAAVAERPRRIETRHRRVPDGAGGVYEEEFQLPIWFEPEANGNTPMQGAFLAALGAVRDWVSRHPLSFPPVVIHLTDGAYTDGSPAGVAWQLMQLSTQDGSALVFNCHISSRSASAPPFPDDAAASGFQGLARELYEFSSPLPTPMLRQAQAKGYTVDPGARGYAYNADAVTMIDFLDIGTRAIQDRMETD